MPAAGKSPGAIRLDRSRVSGGIRVRATRESTRAVLRDLWFAPPIHVSKPYLTGKYQLLQAACATGGLLPGDRVDIDLRVENGAGLILSNPTATLVQGQQDGRAATVQHNLTVSGAGSWLEVAANMTILQRHAAYEQNTTVAVESGGEALIREIIVPGRLASNEAFAFAAFSSQLSASINGTKVCREYFRAEQYGRSLEAWRRALAKPAILVNTYWLSDRSTGDCIERINTLQESFPESRVGASGLYRSGLVVRTMSNSSRELARLSKAVRLILYTQSGREAPQLGVL